MCIKVNSIIITKNIKTTIIVHYCLRCPGHNLFLTIKKNITGYIVIYIIGDSSTNMCNMTYLAFLYKIHVLD